jgi:hypothetical protein
MAQNKFSTVNIIVNNVKSSPVSKAVELVVVNDQLVPHLSEVEHGVNTKNLKY